MRIFLVVISIIVAFCQRGRGGSSSSSRSSSSSSSSSSYKGSSSPSYSYSSPSYTTIRRTSVFPYTSRTYISTPTCVEQCNINYLATPELLTPCLAACAETQRRNSRITYGILGTIALLCCGCCGWAAYQQTQNRSSSSGANDNHSDTSSHQPRRNRTQYIESTKRRLNDVSTNYMPIQQFQLEKQMFQKEDWKLFYFQKNSQIVNHNVSFYMKYQTAFKYSFTSRGQDQIGSWTGNGYYLCSSQGIILWMLKDYDDRQAAQQTGQYQLLMYEGHQVNRQKYQGKWYYVGFQNDNEVSGKWAMVSKMSVKPANPYLAHIY